MIIFGIVACYFNTLTQCGAVYDHINHYDSPAACIMHSEDMKEKLSEKFSDDENFNAQFVCLNWQGPKKKIIPFLMMHSYHPKEKA